MVSPSEWDAKRILAQRTLIPWQGTVWRVHWREVPVLDWSLSLLTTGRYHRGRDLFPDAATWPALYTSLAPEVAVWEMVRQRASHNPAFLRNNVLTELEAHIPAIFDIRDLDDVRGPNVSITQKLAWAAIERGAGGILVPSAAVEGLGNLVLFPSVLPAPLPVGILSSRELPLP